MNFGFDRNTGIDLGANLTSLFKLPVTISGTEWTWQTTPSSGFL
jgi:hypothetical protein